MNLIFEYLFPTNTEAKRQINIIHISIQILLSIVLLFLMSLSIPAFVFFSIAVMPTIIFMFLDSKNSCKFESATVSAFNLLGILPYLVTMLVNWNNLENYAIVFLLDAKTWLIIYGASIMGKLVYILLPKVIVGYQMQKFHERKMNLIIEKNELRKLWTISSSDLHTNKNDK
jgi:hypothetical protein